MKVVILFIFYSVSALSSFSQNEWKDIYKESHWSDRDKWQRPEEIIKLLAIGPGSDVADIGSHEGYFTVKLAEAVTPGGTVYAVDIAFQKLEKLEINVRERNITNVRAILGDPNDPKLPPSSQDAILIVDTYHEMKEPEIILANIKKALKPNGRLVICEPIADARKGDSRETQFRKHELESSFAIQDLKKAGFKIQLYQQDFIDRTKEKGDKMWVIVAVKEIQ